MHHAIIQISHLFAAKVTKKYLRTKFLYIFYYTTYNNGTLYVPVGTKELYNQVWGWKEFGTIVEISDALSGDVNGDGVINGTDIQAIINLIVEGEYNEKGDVNEDGQVNGTDIQEVINIIVNAE